jgi:hypothetical protein
VPPTAEEKDQGQWWVPEEVGHHLQMNDLLPFLHCTKDMVIRDQARMMYAKPERMDVREET